MIDEDSTPPATPPPPATSMSENDERLWSTICHLAFLASVIGVPPVIGPLVAWLIKRNESERVDRHGKEAVNFSISVVLYAIALCIPVITMLLLPVLAVAAIVFAILAAIKANNGEEYRYPYILRLIK